MPLTHQARLDFTSLCPGSILKFEGGAVLGTGGCFYAVTSQPKSRSYSVELDARLLEGNGYGIWFHGQYDNGQVHAVGVQYDPDADGIKFLMYPETDQGFSFTRNTCDKNWHHWKLVAVGTAVSVHLDDKEVLHQAYAAYEARMFAAVNDSAPRRR